MADKTVCRKCGKELGPTVRFCGMCGTPVTKEPAAKVVSARAPAVTMQSLKGPTSTPATTSPVAIEIPKTDPAAPARSTIQTSEAAPKGPTPSSPPPDRSKEKSILPAPSVVATAATERMPETAPMPPTEDAATARTSAPGVSSPSSDLSKRSEFQRLLDEVENGFEQIVTPEPTTPLEGTPATRPKPSDPTGEIPMDSTMARSLFDAMVVEHARPVRDFMIEVRLGEPPRTWVDFAMPALRVIHRSAQGMGLGTFVEKLTAYLSALDIAQGGTDRLIRGQLRQAIIDTYSDLIAFMPDAFALEQESNRRESIIVHTLIQQVPGLNKVGTDRIYSAGLTSLALFYVARPNDIAELTGIPLELAQNVVTRFREYRKQTESLSPEQDRAAEMRLLGELADKLEQATTEYDKQAPGMVGDARRRELRRVRGDIMLELGLLLARLGEVERLRELEKLPFSARAASVRAYVQQKQKPKPGGVHA